MCEVFNIYSMKKLFVALLITVYIPSVILVDEQLRVRNRTKGRPRYSEMGPAG